MLYKKKNYNAILTEFLSHISSVKIYKTKLNKVILDLKTVKKEKKYKEFHLSFLKSDLNVIEYIIYISFSNTNTLLHITDFLGNSKLFYTAGLFKHKGKKKAKPRFLILKNFYQILTRRLTFLKFRPVALHLKNVSRDRFQIIKKLKQNFFIKIIKNFNLYPYNGCRKKRTPRKKVRTKKIKKMRENG